MPLIGADEEDGRAGLLDLPVQVTPFKWHPWLVLREADIDDEARLRFVRAHGVSCLFYRVRVNESGGKRGRSGTPGRVAWLPV